MSGRLVSQRLAACPLESRGCVAAFGDDGRMTLWLSTQTPHLDRHVLGLFLGLGDDGVRVVAPDVGGGFGAKGLSVETVIVPWLARKTGRPVRWTESRSENMIAMQHGRAAVLEFTIGGSRDGDVQAYRLRVVQDAGAYPGLGAILPGFTVLMSSGVYAIPKIEADTVSVVTNTTPIGPFRGAGRPEATQAIERAMDVFAAEVGLDPADVRRRNLIAADAFPTTTASGAGYDCGDYERALDLALENAGYQALREEQRRRRESGDTRALGIGVSTYVEITNGLVEPELGDVEITPDGEAVLRTGSFSHGQGHETTFAMIVADRLGLSVESVRVIKGDTDDVSQGTGTYGSKSTQIGGVAAGQAAQVVADRGRELAAEQLEASVDDVVLDAAAGGFHVVGSPTPVVTWKQLAQHARGRGAARGAACRRDLQGRRADLPVRRSCRRGRGRHRDRRGRAPASRRGGRCRHPRQSRWSPRARCTGVSRQASRRRCSRSSSTTRRATRSLPASSATRSPRRPSCPRGTSSRWRRRRRSTCSARRASASPARSERRRRCRAP